MSPARAEPSGAREIIHEIMVTSALESAAQAEAIGLPRDHIILSAKLSGVQDLITVYRELAAKSDYALHLGLTEADMDQEFFTGGLAGTANERMKLRDIIDFVKEIYTSHTGFEYMHITATEEKRWLQRRIEGPDVAGTRVIAVEDTSTSGASVLTAVQALREADATVTAVAVIVDRGAGDAVRAAGLDYLAAYSLDDLGLE